MNNFKKEVEKNLQTLKQYVPVVSKVHGSTHPEFHQVHQEFDVIYDKIKEKEFKDLNLNQEFEQLRVITSNYKIPSDTCETYEAVYTMLLDLDKSYNKYLGE